MTASTTARITDEEAIRSAKDFLSRVLVDEEPSAVEIEEIDRQGDNWRITLAFSRRWTTPRTRAQEVLESLGGIPGQRRTAKVFTVAPTGEVLSMKSPSRD